jgi:hypothetical protein
LFYHCYEVCANHFTTFVENASTLRHSNRALKGKGGLERLQAISDDIAQPTTSKKRKGGRLDSIPDSSVINPMAPSQPKAKKQRGHKVNCPAQISLSAATSMFPSQLPLQSQVHWSAFLSWFEIRFTLSLRELSPCCEAQAINLA